MSYDLMVFDPEGAPKEHQAFMSWYSNITKWNEGHTYGDPSVTSKRLRSWLAEMRQSYPDTNSVSEADLAEGDDGSLGDYSIGKQAIYVGFAWSKAAEAYQKVFELAAKHDLGFFDVSSSGQEVWIPENGSLRLAHQKAPLPFLLRLKRMLTAKPQ